MIVYRVLFPAAPPYVVAMETDEPLEPPNQYRPDSYVLHTQKEGYVTAFYTLKAAWDFRVQNIKDRMRGTKKELVYLRAAVDDAEAELAATKKQLEQVEEAAQKALCEHG